MRLTVPSRTVPSPAICFPPDLAVPPRRRFFLGRSMRGTTKMRRHDFLSLPQGADDFIWATGIEDTFIVDPWPATGRTLDEYELTQHYDCWRQDIGLIGELGVAAARYGIPWYRVNPSPGQFEWGWTDE